MRHAGLSPNIVLCGATRRRVRHARCGRAHRGGARWRHAGTALSARFDPNMSDEQRNSLANLLYVCRDCHELIDAHPHGAELAAHDHEERRDIWNTPVRVFNLNSQALYRAPGHLVIDTTDSGLKFSIEISKSGSDGTGKMKILLPRPRAPCILRRARTTHRLSRARQRNVRWRRFAAASGGDPTGLEVADATGT